MKRLFMLLMSIMLVVSGCEYYHKSVPSNNQVIQTTMNETPFGPPISMGNEQLQPSAKATTSDRRKEVLPTGFELKHQMYASEKEERGSPYLDPTDLKPRAEIKLSTGSVQLEPKAGEKSWPRANRYRGSYDVVFQANNGNETVLMGIDKLDVYLDNEISSPMFKRLAFETYDLICFLPKPTLQSNLYLFVVERTGNAYPLQFKFISNNGQDSTSPFFDICNTLKSPEFVDQRLTLLSGDFENGNNMKGKAFYWFTFAPDLQNKIMELIETKVVTDQIYGAEEMSNALVSIIAQDWGNQSDQELSSYKQSLSNSAWNNKGFKYLIEESKKGSGYYRPIYSRGSPTIQSFTDDTIVCTVNFNLLDIYQQMAHIEMSLRKQNGRWFIYDLGSLQIDEVRFGDVYKKNGLQVGTPAQRWEDELVT